ncbi:uncharacterized protein LOC122853791 [Aphidius gifuensis]|uniref:uncharacterized protein LOC122853791 n=1 Tax=Aphidius gifuensis TaxID=684658 RepID=UPI001CDC4EBF|nr:uncharacterized protein LOC122853791 [Aphidius gifuensis]
METDMEIDMETDTSDLIEKFEQQTLNVQEEMTSVSSRPVQYDIIMKKIIEDILKIDLNPKMSFRARQKVLKAHHKQLVLEWYNLYANEPRLEKICKNRELVFSFFTEYQLKTPSDEHKNFVDLKYLIEFCGYNLTYLDLTRYPFSGIMPLIKTNCLNLKTLLVQFKEMKDEDFKDVFSNMHQLERLEVDWKCKKLTLPMTFIESLEKVSGTLKDLTLACFSKKGILLQDSLASMFPRMITLKCLQVYGFRPSQSAIQLISEMKNLITLQLVPLHAGQMLHADQINMSPIGSLINLERLNFFWDCDDTDELLINLGDNAKGLRSLRIFGTNLTDNGMIAVKKMSQLHWLSICDPLDSVTATNNFITDESIQCLFNEQIRYLDLSNCSQVSNRSVVKLFENLPILECISVVNTNVTIGIVEELSKFSEFRETKLHVCVSFPIKECNGVLKSLLESHNVVFVSQYTD